MAPVRSVQRSLFQSPQLPAHQLIVDQLKSCSIAALKRGERTVQFALRFSSRGKRCRLFRDHGPKGTVVEVHRCGESIVTIARFSAIEVIDSLMPSMENAGA